MYWDPELFIIFVWWLQMMSFCTNDTTWDWHNRDLFVFHNVFIEKLDLKTIYCEAFDVDFFVGRFQIKSFSGNYNYSYYYWPKYIYAICWYFDFNVW